MSRFTWPFYLGASLSIASASVEVSVRAQDAPLLDAKQTVLIEHQDREARMRRIAQVQRIYPAPSFREDMVPAARMPSIFSADVPVLRVVFDEKSFFDTGESRVRPEAAPIIRAVAESLRGDVPDAAMFVAGHTDSRGGDTYNYNLSVSRANAVAAALYAEGVGDVALWRIGFGSSVPLYPNDTPDHMGFNRRVEFLLAARTEAVFDVLKRQLGHVCAAQARAEADRCKRSIHIDHDFEAVQLTHRSVAVPLARDTRHVEAAKARKTVDQSPHLYTIAMNVQKVSIHMDRGLLTVGTPVQ